MSCAWLSELARTYITLRIAFCGARYGWVPCWPWVFPQSEACILTKDEVLGSKPSYAMSFFVCLVCNQKCRLHSSNGSEPSQILSSCAILESDALPSWHYSTSLHGLEWRHHETIVCAPVAQWIAHQTSNLGVAGSSPAWGIVFWLQGEKYQLSHFWKHVRVIKGQAWNIIGSAHLCSNLLLLSFQFWLGLKPHILAQSLLRSPAMWFDFVCRRSNLIGFALCFFYGC